jgi:hypothetical protein
MARLYDNRIVNQMELVGLDVGLVPKAHGNPNVWYIEASAVFRLYHKTPNPADKDGKVTYTVGELTPEQSSDAQGAEIPFCIVADGLKTKPSTLECIDLIAANKEQIKLWIAQTTHSRAQILMDGYRVASDGKTVEKIPA